MTCTLNLPLAALLAATLMVAGCSDKKSNDAKTGAAADPVTAGARLKGDVAPILPVDNPTEYQRVQYVCNGGQTMVLQFFTDQRTRVVLDGDTHVLRPVATEDCTLFLGDSVNVRVVGEKATASRDGIVLLSGCQVKLPS